MLHVKSARSWIKLFAVIAVAAGTVATMGMAEAASENDLNRCRAQSDDAARLRCFESLIPQTPQIGSAHPQTTPTGPKAFSGSAENLTSGPQPSSSSLPVAGKWRLVRTPTHRDGEQVVSIMATAEISGSDIDFAGLNLRCANSEFEILVFVIRPLPPLTRPFVTVNGKTFEASVVSPGTAILLPKEADDLATGQWQSFPNLSIEVKSDGMTTRGLVSLDGFDTALKTLIGACLAR
jgi:hypothetical protein